VLLEYRATCNARDLQGRTPLFFAASKFHADTVRALCRAGADPEAASIGGRTPLCAAACGFVPDTVRALCDAGANVNVAGDQGRTPLYFAVFFEHPNTVRALCDAGADPNEPSDDGSTPLSEAARGGRNDLVWMLVREYGANPSGLQRAQDKALASAVVFSRMNLPEDVMKSILLPFRRQLADDWRSPREIAAAEMKPNTEHLLTWLEELFDAQSVHEEANAAVRSGACHKCFGTVVDPVACVPCGHCVCRNCWHSWSQINPGKCAVCTKEVILCVPAQTFPAQRKLVGCVQEWVDALAEEWV
jgi:hypothetical protein